MPRTRRATNKDDFENSIAPTPADTPAVTEPGGPQQPKRPRGLPKKVSSTVESDSTSPVAPVTNSNNASARKRRLSLIDDEAPPQKQTKGTKNNKAQPSEKKSTTRQKKAELSKIDDRDPLPDRPGRNIHPVKLPPPRRTSQEVAAERKAKMDAIAAKIREGEQAKEMLAQMNVDEEDLDRMDSEEHPRRLSGALRKRKHYVLGVSDNEDDGEEFDFASVDEALDEASDESDTAVLTPKGKKSKQSKKTVREAFRREIEVKERELRGSRSVSINKESNMSRLDTAPRKYQNAGLRSTKKDSKSKKVKEPENYDPLQSGGLQDEDAISARPHFPSKYQNVPAKPSYPDNMTRNKSRKNELVELADSSDNESSANQKARKKTGGKVKKERVTKEKADTSPAYDEFLEDKRWATVFIPTITHALFISREPFLDFAIGSPMFLETIQDVFNHSFPNVEVVLTSQDNIAITAYKRINSRKSKIASAVLDAIKNFFSTHEFVRQAVKVRNYVLWCLRGDGPAYYQTPSPQDGPVRDKPGYQPPDGFLQSEFIFPFAKKNLAYTKNSVLKPSISAKNPPKGLYVLILAAVERGLSAYIKGTYVEPPLFTHRSNWRAMQVFLNHVDCVSERRWAIILSYYEDSGLESDDNDPEPDEALISAYRGNIYIPSSPVKAIAP